MSNTATCTAAGTKTTKCSVCGQTQATNVSALGHNYVLVHKTEPTCGKAGEIVSKCTRCAVTRGENIASTGAHKFALVNDTATCAAAGKKNYKCSVCGTTKSETSKALGHNFVFDHKTEPTCGKAGESVSKCSRCGTTRGESIAPTGAHKFTLVSDTATCAAAGKKTLKCSVCGTTKTETSKALGHNFVFDHKTEPTCGKAGESVSKCSKCGTTRGESIAPTGAHKFTLVSDTATCAAAGKKTFKCSVCGTSKTENSKALGHNFVLDHTTEPTCAKAGEKVSKCTVCGTTRGENIAPTGAHKWNVTNTVEATCAKEGSKTYTCSECGNTKTDVLKKTTNHQYVLTRTDPTCAKAGSIVSKCSVCGVSHGQNIQPTGAHRYVVTNTDPATCIAEGKEYSSCSLCGLARTRTLPKTSHDYEYTKTDPTCCTAGSNVAVCKVCKEQHGENIPPTGGPHTWKLINAVEPTCGTDGYEEYKCANGRATRTVRLKKTGNHVFEDRVIEPECGKAGVKEQVCTVCGYCANGVYISPTGEHDFELVNNLSARVTADQKGYNTYKCKKCGMTEKYVIEHVMSDWEITVKPECGKNYETNGSRIRRCISPSHKNCPYVERETIPCHEFVESYASAITDEYGRVDQEYHSTSKCQICGKAIKERHTFVETTITDKNEVIYMCKCFVRTFHEEKTTHVHKPDMTRDLGLYLIRRNYTVDGKDGGYDLVYMLRRPCVEPGCDKCFDEMWMYAEKETDSSDDAGLTSYLEGIQDDALGIIDGKVIEGISDAFEIPVLSDLIDYTKLGVEVIVFGYKTYKYDQAAKGLEVTETAPIQLTGALYDYTMDQHGTNQHVENIIPEFNEYADMFGGYDNLPIAFGVNEDGTLINP